MSHVLELVKKIVSKTLEVANIKSSHRSIYVLFFFSNTHIYTTMSITVLTVEVCPVFDLHTS